jgi:L-amino acid N-acyltransferase YncA
MSPVAPLRSATADDALAIAEIYAPIVRDTVISFETEPPTAQAMRGRIEATLPRYPWLVSEDAQGLVNGYVYASRYHERAAYRWSVGVTAYIREDSRGLGLGKRLYEALFGHLVRLHYVQAFALIALPNEPSVKLHESMGFVAVGVHRGAGHKLGAWRDMGVWQKALQPPPDRPPEPLPFLG